MSPVVPGRLSTRRGFPVRILFTAIGFVLWVIVQSRLDAVFSFIPGNIPRYAVSGLAATPILWPFWKRLRSRCGLLGTGRRLPALLSTLALLAPFLTVAMVTSPAWSAPELTAWLAIAGSLLLLATTEEILCRGFLMDLLSFGGRFWIGLTLSSVAFAALHISNSHASPAGILNIFLAGVLFGLLRLGSGGLILPIIVHWFWNLSTGLVFGWSVSGHMALPTLFRCTQPPWGAFGPEESILMTVGVAGAVLVLLKDLRMISRSGPHPCPVW